MVPSDWKAGLRAPSEAAVVSVRMPSSAVTTTGSPLRCGTAVGAISLAKCPEAVAAAGRGWRSADRGLAEADVLVGEGDGGHAGEAHLVDRGRGHGHGDATAHRGLPRGDLTCSGLDDVAEEGLVDLGRGP